MGCSIREFFVASMLTINKKLTKYSLLQPKKDLFWKKKRLQFIWAAMASHIHVPKHKKKMGQLLLEGKRK